MALPDNIEYATVKGRFILAVADTADEDDEPDAVPAQGIVHFVPNVSSLLNVTADPPTVVLPKRISIDLDDEGYLSLNGSRTIKLLATDNEALNPTDWTYRVEYNIIGVDLPTVNVQLAAGTTTDVTQLVPLPASGGTPTLIGPPGPPGPAGPPGDGSGGTGTVQAVNGVEPVDGEITLAPSDIGAAAASHNHSADEITSGTLNAARIPNLDATKLTSGILASTRIPTLDASKITTGTFITARIPTLDQSKISGLSAALAERPTSSTITQIVALTQSEYDALPSPDASTLYVILKET